MAKIRIERDNGDYFEIDENVEGAVLKYFVFEGSEAHLDLEVEFTSVDDAKFAADSFDEIKDLL